MGQQQDQGGWNTGVFKGMFLLMTSGELSDFFNRLGIEYLESNRFLPQSLGRPDVRRTWYYRHNVREFDELAALHGPVLRNGTGLAELDIRRIGGLLGYGLFTMTALAAGALAGEYTGIVRRPRHGRPLPDGGYSTDYAWGYPKVRTLGREMEIDARTAGGPLRFANHSANPSCEPDHFPLDGTWRVVFVALRDIGAGEEITVDYGKAYWSEGFRELVER
jgi:hypothetical protein